MPEAMNISTVRSFSQTAILSNFKGPRFAQTLKEASKEPLKNSIVISKPFGLDSPVLLNHKTTNKWSPGSIKEELFSAAAKERRQKRLDHDIAHSPFYESKSFTNTNGKIFTPPISYFKREKSKYFPDFISQTLTSTSQSMYELLESKVSIVRLYSTVSGKNCADSYFKIGDQNLLTSEYSRFEKDYPLSQIIDINIPQNKLKELLVNFSKKNIRSLTPPQRQTGYFIVPEHVFPFDVKRKLNCDNTCSGYIYIIDHQGRIRWATSGFSNEEEVKLMWKCVRGLENELKSLSSC